MDIASISLSLAGRSELTGVVEIGVGVESILPAWGDLWALANWIVKTFFIYFSTQY